MFFYCLGIRLNEVFQERTCEYREHCPYYINTDLGVALSRPDEYQELPTYNSQPCKYFDKEWMKTTSKTSDSQTDGLLTLLNRG